MANATSEAPIRGGRNLISLAFIVAGRPAASMPETSSTVVTFAGRWQEHPSEAEAEYAERGRVPDLCLRAVEKISDRIEGP